MRATQAIILLLLLLLLPGCHRDTSGKVILRIANWGGAGDDSEYDQLVQKIYRDFEKENPGVEIRVEGIPDGYVPKLVLSFIAGTEPDIITLDASSSAVFINNDLLADLSPFIAKDKEFSLSDYFPNVVDIGRRGDKVYHIPNDFTPMVVYYNKRLFDKAGVPYPEPDWTFKDFEETARKLTIPSETPGGAPKQYGWYFQNWMAGWIMWLWNNGGDVLSPDGKTATGYFNSPQNVEAIDFIRKLVNEEHVAPSLSETAAQGVDPFANGTAAMAISGHWSMVGYKNAPKGPDGKPKITLDDLGVVELPHNTPEPNTVMYESGYAIGKHSRHKDLAWKFIKYFTSYRIQSQYNSSGIAVCARKDVARERAKDPLEASFLPIIPSARAPWGTRVEGYEFVEARGSDAMAAILQNGKPVSTALTEAATRIDREFAKK